ncbi:hypothetical protein HMPREF1012_03194 [Bacillus sp. BT1B_CT2]|uniref:hypothetical protein n=1 Tax=Bacillus sp. BT1B_CT2 TaxID=665958 RepID=UPI0001F45434|nr:hypothetical protein [Bacillus sp. BT1B_CT2]EFV71087.1 hypothetical protein HMPREF1012_03194 [Bacillus sp. BT1B_CT2]WHF44547.1 hypothetical protein QKW34_19400 [Bacillus licheniformis]
MEKNYEKRQSGLIKKRIPAKDSWTNVKKDLGKGQDLFKINEATEERFAAVGSLEQA